MKRAKAIQVSNALTNPELKVKFLSGAHYVQLLGFKRPLTKYLDEMGESEKELFKEYGIVNNITVEEYEEKLKDEPSLKEKIDLIQAKEYEPKEVNFIPMEEFKKFVDGVSVGTSEILAEFLLKEG